VHWRADRHEQLLTCLEVDGREVDLWRRAQVIVTASTTMSTLPSWTVGSRCAVVIALNSILFGSPKIARESSWSMSISNPSSWL
jgi:hypothetical protein